MIVDVEKGGDRNPPYPALGSNIPSARRPGQRFHFPQCRGSSPSLRFVNRNGGTPYEGQGGLPLPKHIHEESDWYRIYLCLCNNYSHPASPASLYLTSPRPILDVLKSLVSRPQVLSPHTRVPMSPSHFYTQPLKLDSTVGWLSEQPKPSKPKTHFTAVT